MAEQLEPGFYALGEEDTLLVTPGGRILQVRHGGPDGPMLLPIERVPEGESCELLESDLLLPTVMSRAAELLDIDAAPALRCRTGAELDVLDEIVWGGPVEDDTPHVQWLVRDGLVVMEGGRAALSLRCRGLLDELCVALCGRPYAGRITGKEGLVQ